METRKDKLKIDGDVLIIGSGAGGGTAARVLAPLVQKGKRIVVADVGPFYTHEHFTQRELEGVDLLWDEGGVFTRDGAINIIMGRMVGGSTGIYTGVTFTVPPEVIQEWAIPGLTYGELEKRFARIKEAINAHVLPDNFVNTNNRLFKNGVEKLGWPCGSIVINVKNCQQQGFCNLGCTVGAKQGTLEVEIPQAIKAGVEIIPNCQIEAVGGNKAWGNLNPAPPDSIPAKHAPGPVEFSAKVIILAGNTFGTSGILLRSQLPGMSPALGGYVTIHPSHTVFGIHPEVVEGFRGFPKTYYCTKFTESHHYYLETCFYYPFVAAKYIEGWGVEHKKIMRDYRKFMAILILNHDRAISTNRIVLQKGVPVLDYRIQKESIESLCHAQRSAARVFFAAGCDRALLPASAKVVLNRKDEPRLEELIGPRHFILNKISIASAHPQGGCRMGKDPATSVTNEWGQVHGYPWLYVCDSSLLPSSTHVNPYLTIMALAERNSEHILETWK
jgi:choline dehydrogenase-like flavoprotein